MKIITYPIFTINQTEISLSSVVIFILILIIFLLFSRFLKNRLLNRILSRFHLEEGFQFTFLRITQYVIISIGVVVAFQFVGIDLSGLTVILGFLSVGIGFGLQNITSNFIAGLILLFERPINVGDRVTVGDTEGDVVNIHIRSTTIKSLNNISIIVPNSEFISSSVINWSHSDKKIRVDLDVGVSYNSDLDLVLKVLKDIALANPEVINKPEPEVQLKNFG
ncbi:mechanosensitive ion channel family protein, partial [Bacteroidota bacterium]